MYQHFKQCYFCYFYYISTLLFFFEGLEFIQFNYCLKPTSLKSRLKFSLLKFLNSPGLERNRVIFIIYMYTVIGQSAN